MINNRIDRISDQVKRELGDIIKELKDPRIPSLTSVISVQVTKDLKFAKAYISVMGTPDQQKAAIEGLKSASGFIRKEIAARVDLRYSPEFNFVLDDSISKSIHISELLNEINKSE